MPLRRASGRRDGPSAPSGAGDGPPSPTDGSISKEDAVWLASMHLWAGAILRDFGVREEDIADLFFEALPTLTATWRLFEPPLELPARTARRRWIARVLLRFAADYVGSHQRARPRAAGPGDGSLQQATADSPEGLIGARDLLRWLEHSTTPERWRVWLARAVDDLPLSEIARQEGTSRTMAFRLLERAYRDLQTAFRREAEASGSFVPRNRRDRSK